MKKLIKTYFVISFFFITTAFADELVVYTQPTDPYWQIWLYNLSANEDKQITTSPCDKKNSVWDQRGDKVLFRTGNGEFYVFDIKSGKEERILANIQYCADPQWITEDEILFTRYRTDVIDDSDIWLCNMKTGKTEVLVSESGLQYQPSISGDRKRLVYVSALNPESHQIFLRDIDANKTRQLTQGEGYHFLPSFSPEGKKIVFVSNQTGNNEIYIMDINTNKIRQLTNNTTIDTDPKWIGSNKIIYSAYANSKFQINTLDINTLETCPLISKDVDCCNPDWIKK